ncbi:MAG: TonB-dependent receptor [Bacteroidetes bacterium]|nr:TonB-dependent receptor [Bacteroidota bacterium]
MRKILLMMLPLFFIGNIIWAQNRPLTGTVKNSENGAAIVGASVVIKGTTKGTVTNNDGKFTLDVPAKGNNNVLVISSVGFTSTEIKLTNQTAISATLTSDSKQLEDAVVIGYGSVKKKDLTGAVGTVSAKEITRGNPANATQALQGQVPGVLVTKLSNKPGQLWSIAIRGENTITSNPNADGSVNLTLVSSNPQNMNTEPLVVIDGVVGGKLQDISPSDIQTIDILKDASSTAIYGSRGANGVVIITSKRGITGKPRVTVDFYSGRKTPDHLPPMQDAQQFYKSSLTDAALNGAVVSETMFNVNELAIINGGRTTDLVGAMTQPGINMGANIAVSGGSNGTNYRFSGGYIQEDGMQANTTYKKYNLNAAVDSKITKFLKVGFTLYANYSTNPTGSFEALRTAYRERPTSVIYYKDLVDPVIGRDDITGAVNGYAVRMGRNTAMNPVLEASSLANYTWTRTVASQMGSAYGELNLIKGVVFKTTISASNQQAKQDEYRGTYSKSVNLGLTRGSVEDDYITAYTFDNQLTYNLEKGKSKLNVTGLQSAFKTSTEMNVGSVTNLPFNSFWYNMQSAGSYSIASSFSQRSLSSYMGRINYTFNDKYLFTFTGRSDGASQLAEGKKWAFFPSGAFAWRLGDENFVKDLNVFSDLKLRVSFGQVGNSVVSPYQTSATLAGTNYSFGQNAGIGLAPGNLPNQQLGWERSEELNLGLNVGFFNNRVTAAIEVYNRTTKDLIMRQALPTTSGFGTIIANVGRVSNKGVEMLVNTTNITTKNLIWTTSLNFTKNVNKLEELPNGAKYGWSGGTNPENALAVGYPLKSFLYFQAAGIWQLGDSAEAKRYGQVPGQVRIVDQNNDGKISAGVVGQDDRVIIGSQLPNFTLGMTNRVSYKNLDLAVMMYYRNGTMYKNGFMSSYISDAGGGARLNLDYWTRNNPSNQIYGMGIPSSNYRDAIFFQDASFLRIADVTVGYTLPKAKTDKMGIDKMRFYLQLINPAYFTKFLGGDPEYNGAAYQDDVPSSTVTFGFNLGF